VGIHNPTMETSQRSVKKKGYFCFVTSSKAIDNGMSRLDTFPKFEW